MDGTVDGQVHACIAAVLQGFQGERAPPLASPTTAAVTSAARTSGTNGMINFTTLLRKLTKRVMQRCARPGLGGSCPRQSQSRPRAQKPQHPTRWAHRVGTARVQKGHFCCNPAAHPQGVIQCAAAPALRALDASVRRTSCSLAASPESFQSCASRRARQQSGTHRRSRASGAGRCGAAQGAEHTWLPSMKLP